MSLVLSSISIDSCVADCWRDQFYMSAFHPPVVSTPTAHVVATSKDFVMLDMNILGFSRRKQLGKDSIAKYTVSKNQWDDVNGNPSFEHWIICIG